MLKIRGIRRLGRGSSRGFTLTELMIGAAISSLVMAAIVALQLITARTLKELYGPTRSRSERMIALNEIRRYLVDARIGSYVISEDDHRIEFEDPNLGSPGSPVTSAFEFDPASKTLFYDDDIDSSPVAWKVAKGPINITFSRGASGLAAGSDEDSVVTLFVETSADLAYSKVDLRDGETCVYLRNPPSP